MSDTTIYIGEGLRRERKLRMLSQRDLASLADLSPTTIVNLEANAHGARPSTLRKLTAALNVSVDELIDAKK